MINLKTALNLTLLSILYGCSYAKIESNVRKDHNKKITSVYIIINSGNPESMPFLRELKTVLSTKLESREVKAMVHLFDPLELDELKNIQKEITTFKPLFVLSVHQKELRKTQYGPIGGAFDLILHENGHEDAIWKASLVTSKTEVLGLTGAIGSAERTVDTVIDRLTIDGLITPINKTN